MRPTLPLSLAAALLLAACTEPLAEVERLSEVEVGAAARTAGVFAPLGEAAGDPGVVGALIADARGEVDGLRVAPGQVLPYGRVATACGLPDGALGTPIAAAAGYVVRDSDPTSVAPRTHYVTGFRDGCARQVTAALILFGDLATHEALRYGGAESGPYGPTDAAYEEIKARACGVPAGRPCGARMARLAEDTAFLSLYPAFGAPESDEVLLHAGRVAAADF